MPVPSPETAVAAEPSVTPLSSNQQRFWWIEVFGRQVPVYNCPMGLRLDGPMDIEALRVATDRLADRHPSLRTALTEENGVPGQRIVPTGHLCGLLQTVDLRAYETTARAALLDDLIRADLAAFFDMARAPLWRLTLFRLGDGVHHLHLNIHHVISDAWSIGVFFRELAALYDAARLDSEPNLPPLVDIHEPCSVQDSLAAQAFWLEHLRAPLPTLTLPLDHARTRDNGFCGATFQWTLPPGPVDRLRRGAAERGATLFMAVMLAHAITMRRLSGQDDLVVGTMFSGRTSVGNWNHIGCHANTVALRVRMPSDLAPAALLAQLRADVLAAHVHQAYPMQTLVAQLAPERDVGRSTLFSTLLIFQNTMGEFESLFPGLVAQADFEERCRGAAECDLFLQVRERAGGLALSYEYAAELFEPVTIERFAAQFDAVVEALVSGWERPLCELDTLPPAQRDCLTRWNDTAKAHPVERNLLVRLEDQARRQPDAPALVHDGAVTSYAELVARVEALALVLLGQGLHQGDVVAVHHRRDAGLVVALLGTMRAGGVYLPVDIKYPLERKALMVREAGARVVLTSKGEDVSGFAEPGAKVLFTHDLPPAPPSTSLAAAADLPPDAVAYVIFTSGSTGTPKGAAIEHRAIANLFSWAANRLGADALANVMATSSVCFDSSVFELFTPLTVGGCVHLLESALHVGETCAPGLLLSCAPSVAGGLLRAGVMPQGVRTVVLAGEVVNDSLVQELYAVVGVRDVYNLYGLTEAAVYSTWSRLDPSRRGPQPIGYPIDNNRILLLDERGHQVPIGATGEIYIGGIGLAREYVNRPDLTRERFVADPFSPGERLCRTGDLGRHDAEGRILCLGRIDHQVKIRGFRIELGEVEDTIGRHAGVKAALAVAAEVPGSGRCLVAYVVVKGQGLSDADLRAHMGAIVPEHMIPSYFVHIDAIPLNGSGKVDRAKLPPPRPALAPTQVLSGAVSGGPATALEGELLAIWREALQRDDVGVADRLFDLGGHSLLLPRMRAEVARRLGVNVALTQFFLHATVRDFAAHVMERHGLAGSEAVERAAPGSCGGQEDPGALAIVATALRVPGASTPEAFWDVMMSGEDVIREAPEGRWRWESSVTGDPAWPHARWGGWIDGVDDFDPEFFRISAREASRMDPQQRLLLEVAWEACERAGYRPSQFGGGRVAVFVGASFQDYIRRLEQAGQLIDSYAGSGNALSMLANRLSYRFGWRGPSMTVDTACSSSLTALHLARQSILSGEADAALVAGVSLMLSPENISIWGESGMLSGRGRCAVFDAEADGFVPGEGVVAVLLKPLAAARRDGDQVLALLRGSAVNHDGAEKLGLTVPNARAQAEVVSKALACAGLGPEDISLLEAHGTGTPLGDPLELEGLKLAFGGAPRAAPCILSSSKSVLGHLGPAAGLTSVVKVVACMQRGVIPPNLHLRQHNPEFDFNASPFQVNTFPTPWPDTPVRRAGVSAFGFGGANAHVVLEQASLMTAKSEPKPETHLFVLSARTREALLTTAARYVSWLDGPGREADIAAVCHTTARGREPLPWRLALQAMSPAQLQARLAAWVGADGEFPAGEAAYCARVPADVTQPHAFAWPSNFEFMSARERTTCLDTAARAWMAGNEAAACPPTAMPPPRVLLPTTAFERRPCSINPPRPASNTKRRHQLRRVLLEKAAAMPAMPERPRAWLIAAADRARASAVGVELERRGHRVVVAIDAPGFAGDAGSGGFALDLCEPEALERLDGALCEVGFKADELVLLDLDPLGVSGGGAPRGARALLALSQWARRAGAPGIRLVTSGAMQSEVMSRRGNVRAAASWGLLRSLRREGPQFAVQGVDLQGEMHVAALVDVWRDTAEWELALADGQRLVPAFAPLAEGHAAPIELRRGGIYLVTGGNGGIGQALVRWLVESYGARVVIASRKAGNAKLPAWAEGSVHLTNVDVSDPEALTLVIGGVIERHGALHGVFHLAGHNGHELLATRRLEDFDSVLRPKLQGAWAIDRATAHLSLDFLVLFSSLAAQVGNVFQGDYSAANAAIDAFAHDRQARGLRTMSIGWCGWSGAGMGERIGAREEGADLAPAEGLRLLVEVLRSGATHVLVVPADEDTIRSSPAISSSVAAPKAASVAGNGTAPSDPRRAARFIVATLSRVLQVPTDRIDPDASFLDLGVDSINSAWLVGAVNEATGSTQKRTLFFDHATVNRMAAALAALPFPDEATAPAVATPIAPSAAAAAGAPLAKVCQPASEREAPAPDAGRTIAIVGMAGRYPGAESLDAFWQLLRTGRETIAPAAGPRWDGNPPDGLHGAFFDSIVEFDPALFNISPAEAHAMDPSQRLLLETAWRVFEDGGFDPRSLAGRSIGVFVGASASPVYDGFEPAEPGPHTLLGGSVAILANRLSYVFDLGGPSVMVDTLCASSLSALHLAVQSIRRGECEAALVAGVRVGMPASYYIAAQRIGALSATGRCRAFGAGADGMVPGEGVGAMLLKPLAQALADGDHVHALVIGSATNHGGRSSGLAAPNGSAQERVVKAALADAGVPACTIGLVEAHGTGTALGDPIEFDSLVRAFGGVHAPGGCVLGSVKSNVGHLEPAAGITGLLKAVLCLENRRFVPSLHAAQPNPEIQFPGSGLRVAQQEEHWHVAEGVPRRAGVSAFGIGGVNVHVILEEPPALARSTRGGRQARLLLLSDRSEQGLQAQAGALASSLSAGQDLDDVSFTLAYGRSRWPHRAALLSNDATAAADALSSLATQGEAAGVLTGFAPRGTKPRVAFLFSGQSSRLRGAGTTAWQELPEFRAALEDCDARLRQGYGIHILDALYGSEAAANRLSEASTAQPALFALGYAFAQAWRHAGIEPQAVLGHSLGEYAAAVIAKMLDLDQALHLVVARARAMERFSPPGGMSAVMANLGIVREVLASHGPTVDIAAVNAEDVIVVSGASAELLRVNEDFEARGISVHPLQVTHAFHSPTMDAVLDPLRTTIAGLTSRPAAIPFASALRGGILEADSRADVDYWVEQVRAPVQYAAALRALRAAGFDAFIECGPADVLSRLGPRIDGQPGISWLPSVRRGEPGTSSIARGLGELFVRGANVFPPVTDAAPRKCPLPGLSLQSSPFLSRRPTPSAGLTHTPSNVNTLTASIAPQSAISQPVADSNAILAALREIFADALQMTAASLPNDIPLIDLGADSLTLQGVSRALKQRFAVRLSARQLFADSATLVDVAGIVESHLAIGQPTASLATPAPPSASSLAVAPAPYQAPRTEPQENVQAEADLADASLRAYVPFQPYAARRRADEGAPAADEAYVQEFVRRYVDRTPGSKAFAARYRGALADSRGSTGFRATTKEMLYPIVGARASGAHVWDVDGNRYVDITMGYGVHLFGHGAPFLRDALGQQLAEGMAVGPQSRHSGDAAELLCKLTGNERVAFCNSGTEAAMLALRLARTVTERPKIAVFEGCYHGFYDATLVVAERDADGKLRPSAMAPGLPPTLAQDVVILPYGSDEAIDMIRACGDQLAGVIVEPVQSRRPTLQPVEFLRRLREVTSETGAVLIFDEVVTGFRAAPGGAQEAFGIRADLAVYGKVLGGGLPVGAVAGRAAILAAVDGGDWRYGDASFPTAEQTFFATTFGKHPLVMATAAATLRELVARGPALQRGLNQRTAQLMERLNALFDRHCANIRAEHFSSQFRFTSPGNLDFFFFHLAMGGVFVWEGRNFFVSTAHTDEDLDFVVRAVDAALAELASRRLVPLKSRTTASVAAPATGNPRVPLPTREFALSDMQAEVLLTGAIDPSGSAAYNEPLVLDLRGALDVGALETALQGLVDRHDALRAAFAVDLGMQFTHELPLRLPLHDLSAVSAASIASILREQVQTAATAPFDLQNGPLVRVAIWRLAVDRHVLLLNLHHAAADASSFGVMLDELGRLYGEATGRGHSNLGPALQYEAQVAAWQEPAEQADRDEAKAYWTAAFPAGIAPVALHGDRPSVKESTFAGRHVRRTLGAELSRAVERVARSAGTTPFAVMFAAFCAFISRVSPNPELVVGVPASRHPGARTGLVGHCVNLMPVRIGVAVDASLAQLASLAMDRVMEAFDHSTLSISEIVRLTGTERRHRGGGSLNVQFNMDPAGAEPALPGLDVRCIGVNEPMAALDLSALGAGAVEFETGVVKCDLSLCTRLHTDGIELSFGYRRQLFDDKTIESWIDAFQVMLRDMLAAPDAAVRRARLGAGEGLPGPARSSAALPLVSRILEQAHREPGAAALVEGSRVLRFGELLSHSGHVAAALVERGLPSGGLVVIEQQAASDMLVAALGVLRAGGAYAFGDPASRQGLEQLSGVGPALILQLGTEGLRLGEDVAVQPMPADGEAPFRDPVEAGRKPRQLSAVLPRVTAAEAPVALEAGALDQLTSARLFARDDVVSLHGLADGLSQVLAWSALAVGASVNLASGPESAAAAAAAAEQYRGNGASVVVVGAEGFRSLQRSRSAPGGRGLLRMVLLTEAPDTAPLAAWLDQFGSESPRLLRVFDVLESGSLVTGRWSSVDGTPHLLLDPSDAAHAQVLDAAGDWLPAAVPGVLHLAASEACWGSPGHAAATAQRLMPCARSRVVGARRLRTNLQGRRLADGGIEVLEDAETGSSTAQADVKTSAPTNSRKELPASAAAIAAVWSQVLGTVVRADAAHADFFDLGGHSMLAMRAVSRISSSQGVQLSMRDLFDASQLHQFVSLVEERRSGARANLQRGVRL